MIKLSNLEKYFNKNRNNEIHVINDITLELPQKGLVVLLGPSGSGKTTLLNVIGGLDKIQSGTIDFDGEIMNRYKANQWDRIRNEHIGYVFQNYNLLHDQTVYDNIALSLRMAGIKDKDEIEKRINYILDNVGMINYRRRKAAALSGGQQQRVAIARALAKNPKVIIADEPTGNLDSKNTYDIMNILRNISHNKLVVLVTHEESIAKLYADRVIRLKDGEIVEDEYNKSVGGVDVQLETDIYLKDMIQVSAFNDQKSNVEVYSDEAVDATFGVKLIVKNKTLYVQVESDQYKRINLLQKDSEISVFNDHYKEQEIEEFSGTDFNLEAIIDDSNKVESRSVISTKEAFRLAFTRFKSISRGNALVYVMFFLNAAIVGIALGLVFNAYHIEDAVYLEAPKNTVFVTLEENDYEEALSYVDDPSIGYLQIIPTLSMNIELPSVYQTSGRALNLNYPPVYARYFDESTLKVGRLIDDQNQIIITENYAKQLVSDYTAKSLGITDIEDLLDRKIYYNLQSNDGQIEVEVEIVGISDVDDVAFYAKEETIWMIATGYAVYEAYSDQITITDTFTTALDHPIYALEGTLPTYNLGDEVPDAFNFIDIELQATFTSETDDVPGYLFSLESIQENYFKVQYAGQTERIQIQYFATDPENAEIYLKNVALEANYMYPGMRMAYLADKLLQSVPKLLFAGIFLAASSIASYFILRSSLLSRIYEVSVYRALGALKKDLRKIFFIEALILTSMTSLWGYLLTNVLLIRLQSMTSEFTDVVRVTPLSFVVGISIIFMVNILSGIIPITTLLNRTPAEIISKYDF